MLFSHLIRSGEKLHIDLIILRACHLFLFCQGLALLVVLFLEKFIDCAGPDDHVLQDWLTCILDKTGLLECVFKSSLNLCFVSARRNAAPDALEAH
jgi:hypothetical protein